MTHLDMEGRKVLYYFLYTPFNIFILNIFNEVVRKVLKYRDEIYREKDGNFTGHFISSCLYDILWFYKLLLKWKQREFGFSLCFYKIKYVYAPGRNLRNIEKKMKQITSNFTNPWKLLVLFQGFLSNTVLYIYFTYLYLLLGILN